MSRLADEAAYFGAVQDGVDSQQELVESLRQQLKEVQDENKRLTSMPFSSETARSVAYGRKVDELKQQLAASQKQNVMLRWYLGEIAELSNCQWSCDKAHEALAATEADLAHLIVCEKEPVGWGGTSGVGEWIVSKGKVWNFLTTPLYRATRRPE